MAFRIWVAIFVAVLAALAMVVRSASYNGLDNWSSGAGTVVDGHDGMVEDLDLDTVLSMESESARRQLRGGGGHISYGALRRNQVPCNRRGQSYYNCGRHNSVNPYRRGCTRATYCARNNG